MEELDYRGIPELFDPNMATIYGVRSTLEQIIALMKDWFVGGDDLSIMSEDERIAKLGGGAATRYGNGDAWPEADEDFICSARVEVAGPTT